MTGDPFEDRVRRELHQAADQIEPQRSLADLRRRILIWRLFHRHPRRLRSAARSEPEPPTEKMPSIAERVWRSSLATAGLGSCWCGRPTSRMVQRTPAMWRSCGDRVETACAAYCCWRCQAARDGGWILAPWNPQDVWTDVHTWGCQLRFSQASPIAEYLNAAWLAGSARPLRWKDRPNDSPVPPARLQARSAGPPPDVRGRLEAGPSGSPARRHSRLRPRARARHARAAASPDRRHPGRQRLDSSLLESPGEES